MANLSKIKRDNMIAFLEELKKTHSDDASIRAFNEIENHLREKKYGLVWEEHSEEVDEMLAENIPVLTADPERRLCKDESLPWNFIIEGDNLQALYLLEKTHKGKVDAALSALHYGGSQSSAAAGNHCAQDAHCQNGGEDPAHDHDHPPSVKMYAGRSGGILFYADDFMNKNGRRNTHKL